MSVGAWRVDRKPMLCNDGINSNPLVRFTVDVSGGFGVLIRGIFGSIYRRNLGRAVPLLIGEIESAARPKPS